MPDRYVAEGVIELLSNRGPVTGLRILLPRAREAREVLPDALRQAGAHVDVLPVYENVPGAVPEEILERIRRGEPDLLVFTSCSTVANFVSILGERDGRAALIRTKVAAIGPVTSATLGHYGAQAAIVPPENTIASLAASIADHFGLT